MKKIFIGLLLLWSVVTAHSQGCNVTPVNPDLLSQTVCVGQAITPIIINSNSYDGFTTTGLTGTGLQTSTTNNGTTLTIYGTPTVNLINYTASCIFTGFTGPTGSSVSGTITRAQAPTVNQPSNISQCGGSQMSVVFTGSNAASFSWTNTNTNIGLGSTGTGNIFFIAADVTSQQIATITVTPANGSCTGSPKSFTITIGPRPTISGGNSVCEGSALQLYGSGIPAQTNPWTSSNINAATVNSSGLVTGIFTGSTIITYTSSNGCYNQVSVSVYPKASAGLDQNIQCWKNEYAYMAASGTGHWELIGTIPSGLSLNILNLNDPHTGINNFSGPGSYTLRWFNNYGCYDDAVITAQDVCPCDHPPQINLSYSEASICEIQPITVNDNIFLNATSLTFFHNGNGTLEHSIFSGNSFSFKYNPVITDIGKIVQVTIVTDDNDGDGPCVPATAIFYLHVSQKPSAGPDIQVACASRDSATITASGGTGFWALVNTQPAGLGLTIVNPTRPSTVVKYFSSAGTYILSWTNSSGCSDSLRVYAGNDCDCNNPPKITLSATSFSTCGLRNISVPNNKFHNANSVFVSHDGNGNASITITSDSTFTFSYSPVQADTGKSITLTLLTDDPDGDGSCKRDSSRFVLKYDILPYVSSDITEVCAQSGVVNLTASGLGKWTLISTTPAGLTVNIANPTSANTPAASFSGEGKYILKWITTAGCSAEIEITAIDCPCTPVITLSAEPASCGKNNGVIHVKVENAVFPYICSLTGAQDKTVNNVNTGTLTFDLLGEGTYTISVTDAAGCHSSVVILVKDIGNPIQITISSLRHSFCGNNNGRFSADIAGAAPPYTVTVNGVITAQPVLVDKINAGNYTLKVIDNAGCSKDTTITILGSNPISVKYDYYGFDCNKPTGVISVNADGGRPPYAYALNNGAYGDKPVFTDLPANIYTISVIDADLCSAEQVLTPIIKADFSAVDDYIRWHFQYNPLIMDVINNDSVSNQGTYVVRPVSKIVLDNAGNEIGKLFSRQVGDNRLEFYFEGVRQNLYPQLIQMSYLVCESDCPIKCDSATIYLIQDVPCIDNNGGFVNTITPNGDGRNDVLIIPDFPKCTVESMEIRIFNRWGSAVYKSDDYTNDWDGRNDAGVPLPDGTYYYVLSLKTSDRKEYVIKNFVEIIR